MNRILRWLAALILASAISGCTSVSYYAQSIEGHVELMAARKDVGRLIRDPSTPAPLRAKLTKAAAIRRFATDELAEPDNSSYRSYVDVGRDDVTYAVFAAPQFSLAPVTWCFPVFGCVPYRGYFSQKAAVESAAELRGKGLDVYVSGVTAYSTLGWFSDPLLSTMLRQDDTYLASLIFHELAHQKIYVNGDSAFNEAFAVSVETSGTRKWLRATGNRAGLRRYEADRARRADFLALIAKTRDELRQVYGSPRTPEKMAAAKAATIDRLRARYRQMRDRRWAGYRGYDGWFDSPINNAKLAATAVYGEQVPAFLRLYDLCSGDYPRFYAAVRRIGNLPQASRAQALRTVAACH
ncbi:aminopeptidase [Mesorhizobium sp.]|uniref:aminopeptidase n=1 Tax=Mesorhizobium sp. TaxID=1871066 RepID=UPI0025F8FE1D|nr:aminopeptidase [Mesorhizobium sp.]